MKLWRKPFDQAEQAITPAQVTVNKERCKGCSFCVEFCPRKVLKMSKELGPKGYKFAIVEDGDRCANCGFCEAICPEFAVKVALPEGPQAKQKVLAQKTNE